MPELADTLTATDEERLEQAEALVRNYCGWHVAPGRSETITVRGNGGPVLLLPSLHVTAVSSVTDGTTLLVDEDDYTWSAAGIVRTGGSFSTGVVTIALTHGYDDVPPEVVGIVQGIAQRAVDNPGSLVRKQVGPFSDTYSQTGSNYSLPLALLDAEKDVLRRYRIPAVG